MSPRKLRVTPEILYILLSLADGVSHGYAILEEVESRSGGETTLGPSSLYYTLGRLADAGLIEETKGPADAPDGHAGKRRYFSLTPDGSTRLKAELGVLTNIVDQARALGLRAKG
jgi:DNA-binding PadR family transcriptional regulator